MTSSGLTPIAPSKRAAAWEISTATHRRRRRRTSPPWLAGRPRPANRNGEHYILNVVDGEAPWVSQLLQISLWAVHTDEPHRDALASGDLVLVYLAAPPNRVFIGRAMLASPVHDWPNVVPVAWPLQRYEIEPDPMRVDPRMIHGSISMIKSVQLASPRTSLR